VLGPTLGKGRHKTQQEQDITILRTAKDVRGVRGQGQGDEGQDPGFRRQEPPGGNGNGNANNVNCAL